MTGSFSSYRSWLVGIALLASAALLPAATAGAAFSTGKCQGTDISGRGASFARDAHGAWKLNFETSYCGDVGSAPVVSYDPAGSGAGRRVVGERSGTNADGSQSRNQPPRFGMSDEPPTPTGIGQMNQGTNATGDEGQIHVIPAAVGAVVPLVNFPDNCDRGSLPDANETAPSATDFTNRVRFDKTQFEAVWNGGSDADTWGEVFPTLAAIAGNSAGKTDADCRNQAIKRVVRFDDSGTSFAFKDYLNVINPTRGWLTTYASSPDTRTWPNGTVAVGGSCTGSGPTGTNLVTGCSNGNGPLVSKVSSTDGSVGYSDISTARTAGLAITPNANPRDDDVFWTQLQNGSGNFAEGTANSTGYQTTGAKGSNCQQASFSNVPSSTFGDWSRVSGVNSPNGFPICTLTYGLVFDDNATAYGNTASEEAKARSVKDYWSSAVSDAGQAVLFPNDYAPLPASILAIARAGVNSIDWNKSASSSAPATAPVAPAAAPPAAGLVPSTGGAPSNVFSIVRAAIAANASLISLSVQLPGPGVLNTVATANVPRAKKSRVAKKITVGRAVTTVSSAGKVTVRIKPSRAALSAMRKSGKLKVLVQLTYTPTGGTAAKSTRTVVLKQKKAKRGSRR